MRSIPAELAITVSGRQRHAYAATGVGTGGIAAWYTSSFTIGASLSFLFGRVGTLLGWRSAFIIAGILGAAGVLIAWAALPSGDSGRQEKPQPLLDATGLSGRARPACGHLAS